MRYVIISTNNNPDYEYYIPMVTWAWNKIGWEVVILKPFELAPYRGETITQTMRLYASILKMFDKDDILMTSDADMIPLSNYWNPVIDDITCYGRDLTNYHYPICYIAMTKKKWGEVMHLNSSDIKLLMDRDLKQSKAMSDKWEEWWQVDQDIITERLSHHNVKRIDRGIEPGSHLPLGRVDRSNGCKIPSTLIDFHAPRKGWEHHEKIREVLTLAFKELPGDFDSHRVNYMNKFVEINNL